jgi:hypothetical protein
MYLNAEQIARLNQAIQNTFEQTSIAWQAIPHWETGDPGQVRVRVDYSYEDAAAIDGLAAPLGGKSVELSAESVRFAVTVAQATAPTPDALLDAVIARTVKLAAQVDSKVIDVLRAGAKDPVNVKVATGAIPQIQMVLNALIDARAQLEKFGYRAPCCLLTDTEGLKALNYLQSGLSDFQVLLDAANINSVYRVDQLGSDEGPNSANGTNPAKGADVKKGSDGKTSKPVELTPPEQGGEGNIDDPDPGIGPFKGRLLLLGRRQRIAHGGAAATSSGEEPVDLAVSVPPSLEVVGETDVGDIEMSVRIRFAPRLTDHNGVVNVI